MPEGLTDEEYRRLVTLLKSEGFQAFLPFAEEAAAYHKLRVARRLVWDTRRKWIIGTAAVLTAIISFGASIGQFWRGWF